MNLIVYGLGSNGRQFIQEIRREYKSIRIVAVTDTYVQDLEIQSEEGIHYIESSYIHNYEYDYIVVTADKYFDEIKAGLVRLGVYEKKIKTLTEIGKILGKHYCNLCGNTIFMWKYIGEEYNIFQRKEIIGASRRQGGCPICGSSDRTRYIYYIIKNYTDLLNNSKHNILHFAPEYMLEKKIREKHGDKYITADIISGKGDVIADITHLQFEDEKFTYIICNHVMEHIKDEKKAFCELRRCLKPTGILLFTVPICWEEKTYENENIVTENERIENYGQKDHVRLYGNDIVSKLEGYGFAVSLFFSNEVVSKKERNKFGFIYRDSVFMCKKRDKEYV